MLFVYWSIINLILPRGLTLPFQSGQSSSIGVLPTSSWPNTGARNLAVSGRQTCTADCGWVYTAAGSTAPGYYTVPNFGTFNLGQGNIGQANVGNGNIGFGNYGNGNTGRLNNGNGNVGYLNDGNGNSGALNKGSNNIGDNNSNTNNIPCIGYNNAACSGVIAAISTVSTFSTGTQIEGSYIYGADSTGTGLIGEGNQDLNSVGFQNQDGSVSGNIGVLNEGDGLVGANNTGVNSIGEDNVGDGLIGLQNIGSIEIGYNNTFESTDPAVFPDDINIGIDQIGSQDIGVSNEGKNLTGFDLFGQDQDGGVYIDTSYLPLTEQIIFDPTDLVDSVDNIGTDYNAQPANEVRTGVDNPLIEDITTSWETFLEYPAVLSVVDLGCPGDVIQVYDNGVLILTTSIPQSTSNGCPGIDDADEALADPIYSRGFVTLAPGSHFLSFQLAGSSSTDLLASQLAGSSSTGTTLAFRFDYILPPPICKECEAPIPHLDVFGDAVIEDPPEFKLPENIKLYAYDNVNIKPKTLTAEVKPVNNTTVGAKPAVETKPPVNMPLATPEPPRFDESSCESSTNESPTCESSISESPNGKSSSTPAATQPKTTPATTVIFNDDSSSESSESNEEGKYKMYTSEEEEEEMAPLFSPWCTSKHFKMLRETYLPHNEAVSQCPRGLATPASSSAQREILNLIQQCQDNAMNPGESQGYWIGTSWKGNPLKGHCLYVKEDRVVKTKNCKAKRRFVCKK